LPLPSPDLLRFGDVLGFAIVALGGMLSAAFCVAWLSIEGRSAGVFSNRMATFGVVVAVILLGALAFVPIVALAIWMIVATVTLRPSASGG
ncbi:MAG TPA: hypothetical protein VGI06_17420, partial [Acidimicrobiales bacterium]